MKNFRSLVFRKANKLFRRNIIKAQDLGEKWALSLKRAWRWYYKKVANTLKEKFKFSIRGDDVNETRYRGQIIEYIISKRNGQYIIELWQNLSIYKKAFVEKRGDVVASIIYMLNSRNTTSEPFYFLCDFFPARL
jgi:hypothetical protein